MIVLNNVMLRCERPPKRGGIWVIGLADKDESLETRTELLQVMERGSRVRVTFEEVKK